MMVILVLKINAQVPEYCIPICKMVLPVVLQLILLGQAVPIQQLVQRKEPEPEQKLFTLVKMENVSPPQSLKPKLAKETPKATSVVKVSTLLSFTIVPLINLN